ncbi:bifunctional phosphopantothenoylcysteine decarboxylase/phosphopantothenate--cysteine ligase CoaBC [Lamprobacter modestohalophilus]|uniref:Coenzyme A biosynthesis bifunctional protein CoaBC n=1 Tax=Lamprobacter modestohalophilus TaxID=1064514 RepID=A0A9X0W5H5_9GAMM|nr:bifunctional phosphopantothenoylcysteine decarboxylase/phosphopantothenate--cysteine ligase CoaBC [Lamprobacter modestohalophilus]MBK1617367.1 bifunctional phosphopantothenoylcysteine decarboxylase/phosphopantothenate--cysteine ligase CoaBC [Lamprobacter modestohalophilus]
MQAQLVHVLLGISGGIAAYKSAELVRRLIERGAEVRVVMTRAAQAFITPLTLQALSGHPVRTDLLSPEAEAGMDHIALARWADQVLIAPATADLIARLACGLGDDLLTTLVLATEAPVAIAPAMNQQMWAHPATQENVERLAARGVRMIGPAVGEQACGEQGAGRMEEPVAIAEAVLGAHGLDAHGLGADQATHNAAQGGAEAEARAGAQAARAGAQVTRAGAQAATPTAKRAQQRQDAVSSRAGAGAGAGSADAERMLQATTFSNGHPLAGRRVLMTVGSTREAIDPVRFIGNRSSGKMGYALAEALRACGAQVMLIAGPTSVPAPVEMMRVDVESALQMRVAVMVQVYTCDLFIATAAVADYRPEAPVDGKIKKTEATMTLTLVRNPDILAEVAALPKPPFTVGFAAETDDLEHYARDKLEAKQLSMIAANRVGDGPGGFESDKNALICLWPGGGRRELPMMSKPALATALADLIAERYAAQSAG